MFDSTSIFKWCLWSNFNIIILFFNGEVFKYLTILKYGSFIWLYTSCLFIEVNDCKGDQLNNFESLFLILMFIFTLSHHSIKIPWFLAFMQYCNAFLWYIYQKMKCVNEWNLHFLSMKCFLIVSYLYKFNKEWIKCK